MSRFSNREGSSFWHVSLMPLNSTLELLNRWPGSSLQRTCSFWNSSLSRGKPYPVSFVTKGSPPPPAKHTLFNIFMASQEKQRFFGKPLKCSFPGCLCTQETGGGGGGDCHCNCGLWSLGPVTKVRGKQWTVDRNIPVSAAGALFIGF